MIALIENRSEEIKELCRLNSVKHLSLFGSAASEENYSQSSDLDFLVEFEPVPFGTYADAYFSLKESLERLLERPVDLVVASAISNPYFLEAIEATRLSMYDSRSQEISARH